MSASESPETQSTDSGDYPGRLNASLIKRLAGDEVAPRRVPEPSTQVDWKSILETVRSMSTDERREVGGRATISCVLEHLVHEQTFGARFSGPVDFRGSDGELRLSIENGPGFGENFHRAFRKGSFTAGEYRQKYLKLLEKHDEHERRNRKQEKRKQRIEKRKEEKIDRLNGLAEAHSSVEDGLKTRLRRHDYLSGVDLSDGGRLERIEAHERGRGLDLKATRLSPETAMMALSVMETGAEEAKALVEEIGRALDQKDRHLLMGLRDLLETGGDLRPAREEDSPK